jgi:outer membrane protein assembly factor BamB
MKFRSLSVIGSILILSIILLGFSGCGSTIPNNGGPPPSHHYKHTTPKIKWTFMLDEIPGTPILDDNGTIYLPAGNYYNCNTSDPGKVNGFLYAINPNGSLKWKLTLGSLPYYSKPIIGTDGTIYINTFKINDPTNVMNIGDYYLYAVNSNGTIKWQSNITNVAFGNSTFSSPKIGNDGTLYIGTGIYLDAINQDGSIKWSNTITVSSIYATPVIYNNKIFINDICKLAAFSTDGDILWVEPLMTGDGLWSTAGGEASPISDTDGNIYLTKDTALYSFTENGILRWRIVIPYPTTMRVNQTSLPCISSDGIIYTAYRDYLFAFTKDDGKLKWQFCHDSCFQSGTPILTAQENVVFVQYPQTQCIDKNGVLLWDIPWSCAQSELATNGIFPIPVIDHNNIMYFPQPQGNGNRLVAYDLNNFDEYETFGPDF